MPGIKVMSYNIQGHAASRAADHLPKLAEVIAAAAPHVVGLQEVHCGTRVSPIDQAHRLAELTGLKVVFGKSCAMDGGDYGNAILTRGEVKGSEVHPLPGSGEPRSLMRADIAINGSTMTFFVTHLAAWGRLLRVARIRQIEKLSDIVAGVKTPHVLVGDFNVPPGADEMRMLLSRGHFRACGEAGDVTFPMTRQRLDYILCDSSWQCLGSEIIRRGPSDHWPVVAELEMR